MTAQIVTTPGALREALGVTRPGLVPTMGALHAGHLSLIARSARENRQTVVSVFVNPAQFSDPADLDRYPRNLERDATVAADAGADLVFAPDVPEIYPPGFDTAVEVGAIAQLWEGVSRPGHFRGVATVVTILLNVVQPARTYFGEKDYQQLQIVRRFHRDLALSGEIVGCPTVRDEDGLALSSRNARLSKSDRIRALVIPRAIARVQAAATAGKTDAGHLERLARAELDRPGIDLGYAVVVDGQSLEPIPRLRPGARLLIAAAIGGIRLIDNAEIVLPETNAE